MVASTPLRRVAAGAVVAALVFVSACASSSAPARSGHPVVVDATTSAIAPRPSAGCADAPTSDLTLTEESLTVAGTARSYLESSPPKLKKGRPVPVVLDFHGLAEGDALEALTTQLGPFSQKHGFIAVFPEGTGVPIQWDTKDTGSANSDIVYVAHLLDQLEATQCVDETRIYATGLSDGAFMTSLLACALSNRIAAFAPVSGVQLQTPCAATHPVPVLAFHGTADPILYFNGGIGTEVLQHAVNLQAGPPPKVALPAVHLNGAGYPATVAAWAKRDGCKPNATNTKVASHVIRRTYACPTDVAVTFYIILGGGHAWPGSAFSQEVAAISGPTTFEISANSLIWAFFKRFQLSA